MDVPLLTDDFKDFLQWLTASRVDYMLVGGYAVGLHGYPRATVDLDVWVRATAQNATRIVAALRGFGFDSVAIAPELFVDPRNIVRFGVPPFRIEIMTSIDGVDYDGCRARAVDFDVDGLAVPTIALGDLRVNKRAAGRHKDLADLENLPTE